MMGHFQRLFKELGSTDARGDPAVRRSQRFKYAVLTSLASKLFTPAIQMLAMPMAIRALGAESFALYAMLTSALTWLSFANFGVGHGSRSKSRMPRRMGTSPANSV